MYRISKLENIEADVIKQGRAKRELRIKESKELNSTRDHSCLVTVGPNGKQMLDSHANRTQSLFILTH